MGVAYFPYFMKKYSPCILPPVRLDL